MGKDDKKHDGWYQMRQYINPDQGTTILELVGKEDEAFVGRGIVIANIQDQMGMSHQQQIPVEFPIRDAKTLDEAKTKFRKALEMRAMELQAEHQAQQSRIIQPGPGVDVSKLRVEADA